MSDRYQALVIGAGHNGLVAALRLARGGMKVAVLERRPVAGGLCAVETFHPGFSAPGPLHDTAHLRQEVLEGLGLASRGLSRRGDDRPVAVPLGRGAVARLYRDPERTAATLPAEDAEGYRALAAFIGRVRPLVRSMMSTEPPPMGVASAEDLWDLGKRGLALRRLGQADMLELMRVVPMCAADWLGEQLRSDPLKAAVALPGVLGTFQGPWSAGSAGTLLLDACTADAPLKGGAGGLIRALLAEAEAAGITVRTGAEVSRVRLSGGRVVGVSLTSGEEMDAPVVAASCDPRRLMMGLIDPIHLPIHLEDQIRVFRCRGTVAKVNLALRGPLDLGDGQAVEALSVAGESVDDLERAYDPVKYRRMPERPALEVRVPSAEDPSLAPDGHHVVSILAGFVPHALEGGWTGDARVALGDRVVARLAEVVPGVADQILAREVLAPPDIEARYGVTGGQVHHGEHALDQLLLMRPTPAMARYKTPFPGLYLCGSGSHPGGGVTGAPGWLGAGAILSEDS